MRKEPDSYARECYCRNLRYITSQITRLYDQHLKKAGITSQQFSTLEYICAMEPVSVTELSQKMGIDRTSLSRNLKIMKSNFLIEDHERSGRSRQIILSEYGRKTLLAAEKDWENAQSDLESIFDPGQLKHFKELIDIFSVHFK